MGFGAKPRWFGNEGEALPILSRARCERMLTDKRGFGGKTVVCQRDNHIYKCLWRYNMRLTTDELIVLLLGLIYEQEKMTEQQKARIYKRVFSLVGEVSKGGES